MENKDIIKLEDEKEYIVLDIIDGYFYLTNIKNHEDFCIRKLNKPDEPTLTMLKDKKEFDNALKIFSKKYNK